VLSLPFTCFPNDQLDSYKCFVDVHDFKEPFQFSLVNSDKNYTCLSYSYDFLDKEYVVVTFNDCFFENSIEIKTIQKEKRLLFLSGPPYAGYLGAPLNNIITSVGV
jgi:hypothetical protein